MPPKIRHLKAKLLRAGFTVRSGKGSHTVWHYLDIPGLTVTLSGQEGKDAKPYQVDDVEKALEEIRKKRT